MCPVTYQSHGYLNLSLLHWTLVPLPFRIAKWLKAEPERQKKLAEEKRKRLAERRGQPKHYFEDHKYMEQIKNSEESMGDALKQGSASLLASYLWPRVSCDRGSAPLIRTMSLILASLASFPAFRTPTISKLRPWEAENEAKHWMCMCIYTTNHLASFLFHNKNIIVFLSF